MVTRFIKKDHIFRNKENAMKELFQVKEVD